MTGSTEAMAGRLWSAVGGSPDLIDRVTWTGPETVFPSIFSVTALAGATVGGATLAAAELLATRAGIGSAPQTTVERRQAAAAFSCELLFTPIGWDRPPFWDPIAGDYETADGWIRLHTNYPAHRLAAERIVGASGERATVAAEVRRWSGVDLETAIVAAGGCAAVMHDRAGWLASAPGAAAGSEPLVRLGPGRSASPPDLPAIDPGDPRPFAGVRVLDLTRVLAGPVCTRFLAAHGAEVLRIDPPGFAEVPALVPEMTAGKHCAALDLRRSTDRRTFEALVRDAHVFICGYRPGAIAAMGYDADALAALNPALVQVAVDAYGWDGPWRTRRGFDSLVQMSVGIAAAGARATGRREPVPLPVQALDHGTGHVLATAIGRAMSRLLRDGDVQEVRASLVGTAQLLFEHPTPDGLAVRPPDWSDADTEPVTTAWGPARRAPIPGAIDGVRARLDVAPGPLGRDPAAWGLPNG